MRNMRRYKSMDYDEFVKKVKSAKQDTYSHLYHVKVKTNSEHTHMRIYRDNECKHCGHITMESVIVTFKKSQRLSIFQAGLLFSLFYLNRKPVDYASYHKCPAGKEFIDNINEVVVE